MTGKYRAYPEYRKLNSIELDRIPVDWSFCALKCLLTVQSGDMLSANDVTESGVPVVGGNGIRGYTKRPNTVANTLVIGRVGAKCGCVHIIKEEFWASEHAFRVIPRKHYDLRFMGYYLQHLNLNRFAITTAQPLLNTEIVVSKFISAPSNEQEQTQIANFLDRETAKIDALIEKQQRLIALLKEKRQAVISHAVTKGLNPNAPMKDSGVEWLGEVPAHWEVSRLKFEADVVDCRNKTPEYFENGEYFVVRTTNVKNQQLNFDGALYTDFANFKIWTQRGVPPEGSILFTREAPTGEVCLAPGNLKFCLGQRMMNFIAKSSSYSNYLFDYLISDCLDRYINSVSFGSTVTHLRVEQVENIPVLVPPLEEVQGIHSHIRKMKRKYDAIEKNSVETIELLKERRTALISAAVTGKIDVRDHAPAADDLPL